MKETEAEMVESLIALGSNLGDREASLREAIKLIGRKMKITKVSSVYETEPMYYESQGWFLNCVVEVETDLKPGELLERLQSIEVGMGRKRIGVPRYGPRPIDLDILFYADRIVSEPGLEVPHPKIAERLFVLVPLSEIRPDFIHPLLAKSASELLESLRKANKKSSKREEKIVKKPKMLADLALS